MSVLDLLSSGKTLFLFQWLEVWFRIHFICVYLYIGYTLLLLYYHQKRFINLRHRFLNASSQENIWRTRLESLKENNVDEEAEHMSYSDAIRSLVTSAIGYTHIQSKALLVLFVF